MSFPCPANPPVHWEETPPHVLHPTALVCSLLWSEFELFNIMVDRPVKMMDGLLVFPSWLKKIK